MAYEGQQLPRWCRSAIFFLVVFASHRKFTEYRKSLRISTRRPEPLGIREVGASKKLTNPRLSEAFAQEELCYDNVLTVIPKQYGLEVIYIQSPVQTYGTSPSWLKKCPKKTASRTPKIKNAPER
jgi:hypothetical protein